MNEETKELKSLPSVSILFKESWELFKKSAVKLLILTLISYLAIASIVIAAGAIVLVLGFTQFFTNPEAGITQLLSNPPLLIGLIFVAIAALVLVIIANIVLQISMVLAISDPQEKPNYQTLIKRSLNLVGPYFLVGLLTGLLVIGSVFLFIVPGIVIGIFLAFANYELLLNNKKGTEALKRSFALVSTSFFPLLGRFALFAIISIILSGIGPKEGPGVAIMTIINTLIGWFGICYSLVLYKQVSERNKNIEGKNLRPLVITSIIGAVVAIGLIAAIASVAPKLSEMMPEQNMNTSREENSDNLDMPTEEELNQMMNDFEQENTRPVDETI